MRLRLNRRQFVSSVASMAAVASLPVRVPGFLGEQASHVPLTNDPLWNEQGILNLAKSPHARLKNIPVHAVKLEEGFWASRRTANVERSIPSMGKLLEVNGRMDNFLRLAGKSEAPQRGPVYSDSDVYKWLEAVGFALQSGDNPALRALAAPVIQDVIAAQQADGYLGTYYVEKHAAERMQPKTQQWGHELYDIGHLLQGGTAYYRGTGDRTLLDAGIRFVNDFLLPSYGPAADKKPVFSGHPEMEMALVELYRMTRDPRHLEFAEYMLQGDERIQVRPHDYVYHFCGKPFTSRAKLEGHAVRAMYACCGATDCYLETGDKEYWKTLETLWNDLVSSKMYITGGVGARSEGEAFGDAYELPNAQAYGESCAAIGNMMWNWRMLAATGDARYTDVIERALYNGINSGMSLDGTLYCYRNPLAFDPESGDKIRNDWYDTTCCPPNLERTFAALPGYFYSTSSDGLYVHLYHNSTLNWNLEDGTRVILVQNTEYPWKSAVDFHVNPQSSREFTIHLRIPGWSERSLVKVNGKEVSGATAGRYLAIRRRWAPGDAIQLFMDTAPKMVEANARVVEDRGRVAVQRGPLVYCLEQLDQPKDVALADLALVASSARMETGFSQSFEKDLLGGVVVLTHPGAALLEPKSRKSLYFSATAEASKLSKVELRFIPYYAWANRTPTPMEVWTPLVKA